MKRLIVVLTALLLALTFFISRNVAEVKALDENKCLMCHGKPEFAKPGADGKKVSLYVRNEGVSIASHRYIDCTTCHTSEPHKVQTPLTKLSLAEKCGTCHQYEYKQHSLSIHGQQLAQGNGDVATCVDCHSIDGSPHNVIRVLEYNAPAYKKNIADTCGSCHGDDKLMASYGILEKTYESYMRSFHGKATSLSSNEMTQLDKATCTNCHGVHDIKSASDPAAPVAGLDNLVRTCDQCHEGAGAEFARGFLGHKEADPQNIAPAYYAELLFKTLQMSVVGVGLIIVVLAVVRFTLNKWR